MGWLTTVELNRSVALKEPLEYLGARTSVLLQISEVVRSAMVIPEMRAEGRERQF
jgi:hypothetical protein